MAYIVCGSNRTRGKVLGILGRNAQAYHLAFTEHDMNHRGIYEAADKDDVERCLRITGARRLPAHKEKSLRRCWS